MELDIAVLDGRVIAHVGGELDVESAPRFRRELDAALERADSLELHLEALTFLDSSGLGAILGRYRRLCARKAAGTGSVMSMWGARPPVEAVLRLSGVDAIIPLFPAGVDSSWT